jgi:hypothetical protein
LVKRPEEHPSLTCIARPGRRPEDLPHDELSAVWPSASPTTNVASRPGASPMPVPLGISASAKCHGGRGTGDGGQNRAFASGYIRPSWPSAKAGFLENFLHDLGRRHPSFSRENPLPICRGNDISGPRINRRPGSYHACIFVASETSLAWSNYILDQLYTGRSGRGCGHRRPYRRAGSCHLEAVMSFRLAAA